MQNYVIFICQVGIVWKFYILVIDDFFFTKQHSHLKIKQHEDFVLSRRKEGHLAYHGYHFP